MLTIEESTRQNPAHFVCDCGKEVTLCLHHDYLENACSYCGKHYAIKVGYGAGQIWNCCCPPENPPIKTDQ